MTESNKITELSDKLGGEYELISRLKSNRRGEVFLVYDRICRRKAVLKTVRGTPGYPESEASVMSALAGEGVPAVYACAPSEDGGWLLREYIPGETLDEYVKNKGPLKTDEVISLGIRLCGLISRLHSHEPKMIHRDIKPQNIVRGNDGRLTLIDFGTCREYNASADFDTQVMGTPASAPPEQFGYCQTDPRSDVYSIGVLLNFLSTGEYASGKHTADPKLKPIIGRCTRFAPDNRYPDAEALKKALEKLTPPTRRKKAAALCTAAVLLTAIFILIVPPVMRGVSVKPADPPEIYRFADPIIEAEVCRMLGKDEVLREDLNAVTELMLIGSTPVSDWDDISTVGSGIAADGTDISDKGSIYTLEDIAAMPNLHTLALCRQEIADLSPLENSKITRLALHGNHISDVSPLSRCPSLSELILSDNPVSVLTPLAECRQLTVLNVGATRVKDLDVITRFPELSALNISFCFDLADCSKLAEMSGLRRLCAFPVDSEMLNMICGMENLSHLEIWCSEDVENFEKLSNIRNLNHLLISMLDDNTIRSFDGIEKFPALYYLHASGAKGTDISALSGSRSIGDITLQDCGIDDFSVLGDMPGLRSVSCESEDYDKIKSALSDKSEVTVKVM